MTLNIKLLETSFEKIKPNTIEFSASFYQKLLTYHPELKLLFANTDLVAQEKKLIASLALIVENLHNPEELTNALKSLGAYHHEIGALPEHYPYIGQALIETFAEYLDRDWNLDIERAWTDAYNLISEIMLAGAKNPGDYLEGELTFYDWLDLYGESSPTVKEMIVNTTHFEYRNSQVIHKSFE